MTEGARPLLTWPEWFDAHGFVWDAARECHAIAWGMRDGYDFTELEFRPWKNLKYPDRYDVVIGHHASGTNPRMCIGSADSPSEAQAIYEGLRQINGYPEAEAGR